MTDRQVTMIAVFMACILVGGAVLVTRFEAEFQALLGGSGQSRGGERDAPNAPEKPGSGEKSDGDAGPSKGGGAGGGSSASGGGSAAAAAPATASGELKKDAKSDPSAKAKADKPRDAKVNAPPVRKGPLLALWGVRVSADANAERTGDLPESVAVDNAGFRVLVQTARAVDVWTLGDPAAVRVRPKDARAALVAPNGARMYFVRDGKPGWSLETCEATGKRVGVWEPGAERARAFGPAGFHSTTHELTVGIGTEDGCSFDTISPTTGQPEPNRRLVRGTDVLRADLLFPRKNKMLLHFPTAAGSDRPPGLYSLLTDGTLKPVAAAPADPAAPTAPSRPVVSNDGHRAAVLDGASVKVWDLDNDRRLFSWELPSYRPKACWLTGGRLVVAATGGLEAGAPPRTILQMYDLDSFKRVGQFLPSDYALPEAVFAFSPDGTKLALADRDEAALVDASVAFGPSR
ncbi:hypothetical protein R5W23_001272 [Gemmata sp. JC673]|uniref:WD40 repeat domain-containing protein n=1 Tax=Gemmata algarum TaxID=2975278 RepID=A0ABU5EYQ1_9BACT|nr:hypothetical protein [Gemmata algarum]MDY3560048.1 hypothetical protein [Gemmata algarum]